MGIFCHGYIASHSKQNHQAPENEHQAEKSNRPRNHPQTVKDTENKTARGITPPRRLMLNILCESCES